MPGTLTSMDTDLVEQSGTGRAPDGEPVERTVAAGEAAESTSVIDDVDRLLDEVEAALGRLDEGTYGTCAGCGGTIDDVRLSGDPTTLTCAACDGGLSLRDGSGAADRATDESAMDEEPGEVDGAADDDAPNEGAVGDDRFHVSASHELAGVTDGHAPDLSIGRPAPVPWERGTTDS
jgi:DnaK suppressor protein